MEVRSCFAGLAKSFAEYLVEGTESRWLFDYHRGRIEELFASQPDLPLHQDTVAGFLHGVLVTCAYFVADDSMEGEVMGPMLGGTLLLGQDLPIDADPADITAGRSFFERAAQAVGEPDETGIIRDLVWSTFTNMATDVPMTCASLGGFCLGVLYSMPYLTESDAGSAALIAAACELAQDLAP